MSYTPAPKPKSFFHRWSERFAIALLVLLLLTQDMSLGWAWICQLRSANDPTTEGVVLAHQKKTWNQSTKLVVEYEYEVNGVRWISEQYRYEALLALPLGNRSLAAHFPVGARVPVSYNPSNPDNAVLLPGFEGIDLATTWIMVLFHIFLASSCRSTNTQEEKDSLTSLWIAKPFGWRLVVVRERSWSWPVFWAWFGLISWGYLGGMLGISSTLPSAKLVFGLVVVAGVSAVGIYLWLLRRSPGPNAWLTIDVAKRELRWHPGEWFHGTFRLPFEAITAIRTRDENRAEQTSHHVEIDWYTSQHRTLTLTLTGCTDLASAKAVAARLREVGLGLNMLKRS